MPENVARQRVDFLQRDAAGVAAAVGQQGAALGLTLQVGQPGEPEARVALGLVHRSHKGAQGTVQIVLRELPATDVGQDGIHGAVDANAVAAHTRARGGDEGSVVQLAVGAQAGRGGIALAQLGTQSVEQLFAHDGGEHAEPPIAAVVAAVACRAHLTHDGLIQLRGVAEEHPLRRWGKLHPALLLRQRGELGTARRQRAETALQNGQHLLRAEIAHERDLHSTVAQPGLHGGAHLGGAARLHLLLVGHGQPGVAPEEHAVAL